jgi:hypothetical protein
MHKGTEPKEEQCVAGKFQLSRRVYSASEIDPNGNQSSDVTKA